MVAQKNIPYLSIVPHWEKVHLFSLMHISAKKKHQKAHFCKISPQGVLYCATRERENILNDEGYPSLLPVTRYFLIG